jgi:MFS transporter, DHA3 family, tetracycline resistance protein
MISKIKPAQIYNLIAFCSSLFFWLVFTVNIIYHVTVVNLNPLQLILIGTILEASVFLAEIPTGIFADIKSRRLSIIIGFVLIGIGFIIEGIFPFFWTVALAQIIWGIGFTFTSGAKQAWITDEIGEKKAGKAFLRGYQFEKIGEFIAIPLSVLIAAFLAIQIPIISGGILMIGLACFLFLIMPETRFKPHPNLHPNPIKSMGITLKETHKIILKHPVFLLILLVGLFLGIYSEGFDRLPTVFFLQDFTFPGIFVQKPVLLFGIIAMVLALISIFLTELIHRKVEVEKAAPVAKSLIFSVLGLVIALTVFAFTKNLWVALIIYWIAGALRNINTPLYEIWFNQRIKEPHVRATMFSVSSQIDALGQIGGGPILGSIGKIFSIRWALLAAALMLSPVLPLLGFLVNWSKKADKVK